MHYTLRAVAKKTRVIWNERVLPWILIPHLLATNLRQLTQSPQVYFFTCKPTLEDYI